MSLDVEQLKRIRQNYLDEIEEVSSRGAAVDYDIDGQKVNWTRYLDHLWKALETVDERISALDDLYEEHTQAYT